MNDARWKPAPDISWTVELRGIRCMSDEKGWHLSIPYPYAALWAHITGGRLSRAEVIAMMALLLKADEQEAESAMARTLEAWREAGLIVEA